MPVFRNLLLLPSLGLTDELEENSISFALEKNYYYPDIHKRSGAYFRCPFIQRPNITFIAGINLEGVSEHLILSFVCCVLILIIFLILKKIAWIQLKKAQWELLEVGWISLLYNDVYDFIAKGHLRMFGSVYVKIDKNYSFQEMLFYSFIGLKDVDILKRCGEDAMQYLAFHRNIMYYMILNAIVCMGVLMPTNITGSLGFPGRLFEKTTIYNLNITSFKIWAHIASAYVLLAFTIITVKATLLNLKIFHKSEWKERTIIIKNIKKTSISAKSIEKYFKIGFPSVEIEDIKLSYDYKHLIYTNRKLRNAEDQYDICVYIKSRQCREIMVRKSSSPLINIFSRRKGEQILGRDYYKEKMENLHKEIAVELNRLPKKVLPIAFVTFKDRRQAHLVSETQTRSFADKMGGKWILDKAPSATNVIWENIQSGQTLWSVRAACINLVVVCVALFLTTPTIVSTNFNLDKIRAHLETIDILFARFLFTVVIWVLSLIIPALVTYSSGFLEYKTKSAMCVSEMTKTVIFLIFTIVVLPPLGFTSLGSFFTWALKNRHYDWSCIFCPDNGAFFVQYVFTSTFVGTTLQLIRLPDILFCIWPFLSAKSEVERLTIRRDVIWEFSYGIQYSHSLVIFFIVALFSLHSPVISLAGLAYFCVKYRVERYNIYFAYSPSRVTQRVHLLAIKFVLLTVCFEFIGFFFSISMRGGWIQVTYAANALMWITIIIFILAVDPFNWKYFCMIDFLIRPKKRKEIRVLFRNIEQREVYQPMALRKNLHCISTLDKYENPIDARQWFRNLADELVLDFESFEKDFDRKNI